MADFRFGWVVAAAVCALVGSIAVGPLSARRHRHLAVELQLPLPLLPRLVSVSFPPLRVW